MARQASLFAMAALAGEAGAAVPERHYLKGAESRRPCGEPADSGEIVVCGHTDDEDRLTPPDHPDYAPQPLKAEAGLGGGVTLGAGVLAHKLSAATLEAEPDKRSIVYSNRIMPTLTVPTIR